MKKWNQDIRHEPERPKFCKLLATLLGKCDPPTEVSFLNLPH